MPSKSLIRSATLKLPTALLRTAALIIAITAGYSHNAQPATRQESDVKLIKKARKFLKDYKPNKAIKLLEAERKSGTESVATWIVLSEALNIVGNHKQAEEYGRMAATAAEDAQTRTVAYGELAVALAARNAKNPELEEFIQEIRQYLSSKPRGSISDRVRIRLCAARSMLPANNALSLNAAEYGNDPSAKPSLEEKMPSAPRKIHGPQPTPLDREHRSLNSSEKAVFEAILDLDGCVCELKIKEVSSLAYAKIAERTVRAWVFEPAHVEGKAMTVSYNLTTSYRRQ